ncbi:MAG: NIPSNAP family protein, partial [Bacteroidota bacterium]
FEKHGMKNVIYWTSVEEGGEQSKLVYLLAHDSADAAKRSFDNFVKDTAWIKVRDDSEKDGKIVSKIESVFLYPLSFSNIR